MTRSRYSTEEPEEALNPNENSEEYELESLNTTTEGMEEPGGERLNKGQIIRHAILACSVTLGTHFSWHILGPLKHFIKTVI